MPTSSDSPYSGLRRYLQGLLVVFPAAWPTWLGLLSLILVLAATVVAGLYAIQRWGYSTSLKATSNAEKQPGVVALAFSSDGRLLAARRDTSGVTLLAQGPTLSEGSTLHIDFPSDEYQHLSVSFFLDQAVITSSYVGLKDNLADSRCYRLQSAWSPAKCKLGKRRLLIAPGDSWGFLPPSTLVIQEKGRSVTLLSADGTSQSTSLSAPCSIFTSKGSVKPATTGVSALFACEEAQVEGRLFLMPDTSQANFEDIWLQRDATGHLPGVITAALSEQGEPAVSTDQGAILVWTHENGLRQSTKIGSPGIAQALAYSNGLLLVGGGFRGVYLADLRANTPAQQQIIQDVTGVSLLATYGTGPTQGTIALATSDTLEVVSYSQVRRLNDVAGRIIFFGALFWLFVFGRPFLLIRSQTLRTRDEVRIRGQVERTLEKVPVSERETIPRLPAPTPPAELVQACVSGDCVAFLGAGIGAQAGLPTWRALIQSLLSEFTRNHLLSPYVSESLQEAFDEGRTDLVADGIVSNVENRTAIYDFLVRAFVEPRLELTEVQRLLPQAGFSAVLTTNFDNLLEAAFAKPVGDTCTHQDAEKLLTALSRREFFLLKLYGSLDRPDSILLAPFQYVEAMARNVLFSRFMETLFTSRTLLFMGASLEGIEAYLSGIRFPTALPKKHFALVAVEGVAWRAKAEQLERRFGIRVLPFTAQPGFPELEQFLEKLVSAVQKHAPETVSSRGEVARLHALILENIGPFDHLELTLDPRWTILLGDNGVGKSTILRAIAVGLVGSDASDYALRLIKAGRNDATITLITSDKRRYVTTIKKDGARALVASAPSRALEPTNWLALGFPPLRTFTWAAVKELPARGLQRASADDVMPLVSGDTDPRLDTLKGWIIDLDYRSALDQVSAGKSWSFLRAGDRRSGIDNLREEFFDVIRTLTPGFDFGEVRIDSRRKEVFVKTADGEIRIEAVSQGIQSLLGWVGILMQRLFDFYGSASSPQSSSVRNAPALSEQYALVLMDEIDAHMHPKWQQIIVSRLKKLFPNCQVIATTHSPLIVVGMERSEVLLVRRKDMSPEGTDRGEAGKTASSQVVVEAPAHSLRGWGADQALTGPLFGLETVMDPELYKDVESYTQLAAKDSRTEEEEKELLRLAERLKIQRPEPKQREAARLAFKMIQDALEKQLENIPEEKRAKIRDEAKVQIEENITGSRRPG